jgi:hypothetical protein
MPRFIVCPACRRHVRKTETLCPFCDAALADIVVRETRTVSGKGLSRAAILALVATGIEVTACDDDVRPPPLMFPLYGTAGVVLSSGGADAGGAWSFDTGGKGHGGASGAGGTSNAGGRQGSPTDGGFDAQPDDASRDAAARNDAD